MSQPLIAAKPEDLSTAEKRGKYTVCIVGCGHLGILHAVLLADTGFRVICYDSDQTVVNNAAKGKASLSGEEIEGKLKSHVKTGRVTASNDIKKAVFQSDIVVVTIPARVDSKKKVDYSTLESMCKKIGPSLRIGSLVIVMKPLGVGVIDGTVREALENSSGFKVGTDFGLAYSPFFSLRQERIVAASDKTSLNLASAVLEPTTKGGLMKTGKMKVAELAALFVIQQQDVSLALTSELAMLCERLGADYLEATELLKGSINPLLFSLALSKGNVKEEPYLLLADAENHNLRLRVSAVARETNEQLVKHLANLVKDALRTSGKTVRRARISLLGVSQTPNLKSPPKRIAKDLIQSLAARGARIGVYDPYFTEDKLSDTLPDLKKNLTEAVEGTDCIIILTGHDQFKKLSLGKLKLMMKKPGAVVDFEGIIEPDKIEKEGFIYRGLGRGVWTK